MHILVNRLYKIAALLFIWYWLDYQGTIFYYIYTLVMMFTIVIYVIAAVIPLIQYEEKIPTLIGIFSYR